MNWRLCVTASALVEGRAASSSKSVTAEEERERERGGGEEGRKEC